jgi:DNA topoisomerase-1
VSPVLWQRISKGLSGGRCQSVAVRIIVDRENEIRAFKPEEFWKFKALFQNPEFKAELAKKDGKPIKMEISSQQIAEAIERELLAGEWILSDIEEKDAFRNPPPPFITSTLQQTAGQKLGMSVDNTMRTAQALYEGNTKRTIPNHEGGLITYMRTDSLNLSTIALDAIKIELANKFGKEYTLPTPRSFLKKAKGAQEAHEAIRPTNPALSPEIVEPYLDEYQFKLYRLIWNRTMATQMPAAKMANTIYKITDEWGKVLAKGLLSTKDIPVGNCFSLGSVNFPLNSIEKAQKLNLEVSIEGTEAMNDWNFWVYPETVLLIKDRFM